MVKIIEPDHRPVTITPTNDGSCNCSCACACTPTVELAVKTVSLSVRNDPTQSPHIER